MEAYGLEADDFRYIKSGGSYKKVADDYNGNISSRYALKQSSKGVKAAKSIMVPTATTKTTPRLPKIRCTRYSFKAENSFSTARTTRCVATAEICT